LAALKSLFAAMPENPNVAFVVVVHLSPQHESFLPTLLQAHCPLPVQQVTESVALKPDCVYVIPPNANLSAIDTHLRLTKLEERRAERAPIDHFFKTLAESHDGHSVGVILTGTGSDGTLGLRRIKQAGGLTIAQDPEEAEHDGMPRSAIGTGMVDAILPIGDMPAEILRFARTKPQVPVPEDEEDLDGDNSRILQKIFAQVRARTGHDFTYYKRSTIMRRILRRMQLHNAETLAQYLELIRNRHEETGDLYDDLLITVTEFFRDEKVFEYLKDKIIPRLFASKTAEDRIRVWSVGCSTGEEPYSLAMLLLEAAAAESHPQIQVFASDLHESVLSRARDGTYPEQIAQDVSAERLEKFFVHETGHYRVKREVRETIVFAPHNLLSDPPFSHMDLIVCRNLLIYLQRDVQHDVVGLFHYALGPNGILVLGSSETVDRTDLFTVEDKDARVYRKRNVPARHPGLPLFPVGSARALREVGAPREVHARDRQTFGALHEKTVERFAPPSILINSEHDIVHTSATAGRYPCSIRAASRPATLSG
jgi:two-component system CheB/CheR fusion protein